MGVSKELRSVGLLLNQWRKERGLGKAALIPRGIRVTKEIAEQVAMHVWMKYPQSLTQPDYQLGELTLELVKKEIRVIVNDLRRGVKMTRQGIDIPWNSL